MGYLSADQSQTGYFFESGTYATPTGTTLQWFGNVQNNEINESIEVFKIRNVGTASRNVSSFVTGPEDYTGKIMFYPQYWQMLAFALGSNVDAGSPSPYSHTISEVNSNTGNYATSGTKAPFVSFTIEDSHISQTTGSSFIRTLKGCVVDTFKVKASEGKLVECEVDYVGQNITFSSGAATTLTADSSRTYVWSDCRVHIPSGTIVQGLKDFQFTIKNNLATDHFLNGSTQIELPIPEKREYELTVTAAENSSQVKTFFDQYFKGGSTLNVFLEIADLAHAGSTELFLSMSGCRMTDMNSPTKNEGLNENKLTIVPQTVSAIVNDLVFKYNGW